MLNNLSITKANKRVIALDCGGAKLLGRMLCEDPGCHLLAIVIVNLTFGDAELNRDLLSMGGGGGGPARGLLGLCPAGEFRLFLFFPSPTMGGPSREELTHPSFAVGTRPL